MTNSAQCMTRLKATVAELLHEGADRGVIIAALTHMVISTAQEEPDYEIVFMENVCAVVRRWMTGTGEFSD